jgi:hypothetical protein
MTVVLDEGDEGGADEEVELTRDDVRAIHVVHRHGCQHVFMEYPKSNLKDVPNGKEGES